MSFLGILPSSVNRRLLFFGIFLASLSGLVLEIAITRIFSAAIWYHFAFVAVSVALVGLGSSGLLVHYRLKKIKENWAGDLTIASSIGIVVVLPLILYVMHSLSSQVLYLPLYMFLFAIPFFFVGIVISAAFSAFANVAGRLYAADLIGASLGAILVVFLLELMGGEGTTLVVGLLAAIFATIFSVVSKSKKKIFLSLAFIVLASSLIYINDSTQIFSIPTDPTAQKDLPIFLRENPGSHIVKTEWNSFSRIDVVEGISGDCIPDFVATDQNPSQCAGEGLVAKIFIDGGAGTNIISWDGDVNSRTELSSWMQYIPLTAKENPKVLIIGSGGGRDVVASLVSGSQDVTAVELNPIIFDTVKSYGDRAGNLYTHQFVSAYVDEGRSFVSRSDEKFDIIYIPFVDTWASVSSGGLGVSENFLYTIEGFQEYYDHLEEDGKIIAVRWLIDSPRFVTTFAELLQQNGFATTDLQKHLIIVSSDSVKTDPSVTMTIFSKSPFTDDEVQYMYDSIIKNGYKPILVPGLVTLEPYPAYLNGEISNEEFYQLFSTKVHPVTDDSPFFLSFEKPIPTIVIVLVYVSLIIVAAFILGPLIWLRKQPAEKTNLKTWSVVLYFASLGMGFILIELSLLQKFILLLGNPTTTFAILLFTILIASGIGSQISTRLVQYNTRNLLFIIAGILVVGALYVVFLPEVIYSVIAEEFEIKVIISVGLLFPIGLLMGMPLPTVMRLLKSHKPTRVPWMWAINGSFSVLGAVLSVAIGILYGSSYAMILGISIYFIALCVVFMWKRQSIEFTKSSQIK